MNKKTRVLNNNVITYLDEEDYFKHVDTIINISNKLFKKCHDLDSIDISNVHAGGIQIGGCHKTNPNYIMMNKTFKYDFSNINEIAEEFIKHWNSYADHDINSFNRFTKDGEINGWD